MNVRDENLSSLKDQIGKSLDGMTERTLDASRLVQSFEKKPLLSQQMHRLLENKKENSSQAVGDKAPVTVSPSSLGKRKSDSSAKSSPSIRQKTSGTLSRKEVLPMAPSDSAVLRQPSADSINHQGNLVADVKLFATKENTVFASSPTNNMSQTGSMSAASLARNNTGSLLTHSRKHSSTKPARIPPITTTAPKEVPRTRAITSTGNQHTLPILKKSDIAQTHVPVPHLGEKRSLNSGKVQSSAKLFTKLEPARSMTTGVIKLLDVHGESKKHPVSCNTSVGSKNDFKTISHPKFPTTNLTTSIPSMPTRTAKSLTYSSSRNSAAEKFKTYSQAPVSRLMSPTVASAARSSGVHTALPRPNTKNIGAAFDSKAKLANKKPSPISLSTIGVAKYGNLVRNKELPTSAVRASSATNSNANRTAPEDLGEPEKNSAKLRTSNWSAQSSTALNFSPKSKSSIPILKGRPYLPPPFTVNTAPVVVTSAQDMRRAVEKAKESFDPSQSSTPVRTTLPISSTDISHTQSVDYSNFSNFSFVADWANTPELTKRAAEQRNIDPKALFGSIQPVDIDAIFGAEKKRQGLR